MSKAEAQLTITYREFQEWRILDRTDSILSGELGPARRQVRLKGRAMEQVMRAFMPGKKSK